jgi:hypothetical protein
VEVPATGVAGILFKKVGIAMAENNFKIREREIMAGEIKPQILSLEEIVRRQEIARYGQVVSAIRPAVRRADGPTIIAVEE